MVAEMLALYYSNAEKATQVERQQHKIMNDAAFVRTLLDAIPLPIFSKTREMTYSLCNKAFAEGLGYEVHELTGKTVYDVAPPELADKYNEVDQLLMETGGEQSYEGQVLLADGSIRDILFTKAVYNDAHGKIEGMVGIMQDVTGRKRT
jgi:PAS domain S-box-containing protein